MSLFGGIFHAIFGGGGVKKDPYADLINSLSPANTAATNTATQAGAAGLKTTADATNNLNFVSDWMKKILTGSDDELLKMFDASSLTKNIDENQQQQTETGVRGGARAAAIGQSSFDRDAALNRTLQGLRFAAPQQLATIAGQIGQIGLGEENTATQAGQALSQNIFGVQNLRQQDKARRAELIGSIFEAIGGAAGAAFGACVGVDSLIKTPTGKVFAHLLEVGDEVVSKGIVRKIIRLRFNKDQKVRKIHTINNNIKATPSHVFDEGEDREVICSELSVGSLLNSNIILFIEDKVSDVVIFKLDDEDFNYSFNANGFECLDDDCLR